MSIEELPLGTYVYVFGPIYRNVSPLVVRLLSYMYTNQSMQVMWVSDTITKFNVQNGVK